MTERPKETNFLDLDLQSKVDFIMKDRTPSPEQVVFSPTIEFLDSEGVLSREERAKVVAMGDRTAISYRELKKKVIEDRDKPDKTSSFFIQYALAARSSKEIAHTSILEQAGVGPELFGGDLPIVMEGISILSGLRDVCSQRHGAFEAFSSRGGIFPDNYWRVPQELGKTDVGNELEAINKEVHSVYLDLTRKGIAHYLQTTPVADQEPLWKYRWRILNLALDDSRQVTNGSFLNHLSYHPNSALALRETIAALGASDLPETRGVSEQLRALSLQGMPTIMTHTEPSPYTAGLHEKRVRLAERLKIPRTKSLRGQEGEPKFIQAITTSEPGVWFLAAFTASLKDVDFLSAFDRAKALSQAELKGEITNIFEGISLHDKPPAELEMIRITAFFDLSVGAIYELIRHRGMTHIVSDFSINHGYTIPRIYKDLGLEQTYKYGIGLNERAVDLIENLGPEYSIFVPYFVSRAHLQPVAIRMSGLDAFHLIKIRASDGAHPDIRYPAQGFEEFLRAEKGEIFNHLVKK